jgi:hypothetical protein
MKLFWEGRAHAGININLFQIKIMENAAAARRGVAAAAAI